MFNAAYAVPSKLSDFIFYRQNSVILRETENLTTGKWQGLPAGGLFHMQRSFAVT